MAWHVETGSPAVIQAAKPAPRIMRYELTDPEWAAIKPFLPNKPRGVPRVNNGACSTARIDDPIDAGIADFLGGQIEAELLAHHPGEEPAH